MKCNYRFVAAILLATLGAGRLAGQEPDVRRPHASRAELETGLAALEQTIASSAYSKELRKTKQIEADLVRQRLAEGDFQVGDSIAIAVVNEPTLTGKFPVSQDRSLNLPLLPTISLKGVLRSEVREYLTEAIGKYVKDPQVSIEGSYVRIAILGGVGRPGYYSLPSHQLIADAIMQAGGPAADIKMEKTVVKRNGEEVVPKGVVQKAIEQGLSLDQLNLHGGDELILDKPKNSNRNDFRQYIWPIQAVAGLTFLLLRIF